MSAIMWQQSPDRRTWCAAAYGRVLTVSKLASGQWAATVDGDRSPEYTTRKQAQAWAAQAVTR